MLRGFVLGAGAFVAGLAASAVLVGDRLDEPGAEIMTVDFDLSGLGSVLPSGVSPPYTVTSGHLGTANAAPGTETPETWEVLAWMYHDAHGASLDLTIEGVPDSALSGVDVSVVEAVPAFVPVAVLVLAGALTLYDTGVTSIGAGAKGGAAVTVGYLLAALGTAASASAGVQLAGIDLLTLSVSMPHAVALTGTAFPLVFGSIGGALAVVGGVSDRSSGAADRYPREREPARAPPAERDRRPARDGREPRARPGEEYAYDEPAYDESPRDRRRPADRYPDEPVGREPYPDEPAGRDPYRDEPVDREPHPEDAADPYRDRRERGGERPPGGDGPPADERAVSETRSAESAGAPAVIDAAEELATRRTVSSEEARRLLETLADPDASEDERYDALADAVEALEESAERPD